MKSLRKEEYYVQRDLLVIIRYIEFDESILIALVSTVKQLLKNESHVKHILTLGEEESFS